LLWIMV